MANLTINGKSFELDVEAPTICVAAPAVLNASFAATGKPIRSVPLKDQNITFA